MVETRFSIFEQMQTQIYIHIDAFWYLLHNRQNINYSSFSKYILQSKQTTDGRFLVTESFDRISVSYDYVFFIKLGLLVMEYFWTDGKLDDKPRHR